MSLIDLFLNIYFRNHKTPREYCQKTIIITKYYNKIGNPYH